MKEFDQTKSTLPEKIESSGDELVLKHFLLKMYWEQWRVLCIRYGIGSKIQRKMNRSVGKMIASAGMIKIY